MSITPKGMTRNDGYTRYTVRLPTPLYERVKAASGEKSVNAEIVEALVRIYPAPEPDFANGGDHAAMAGRIIALEEGLAALRERLDLPVTAQQERV